MLIEWSMKQTQKRNTQINTGGGLSLDKEAGTMELQTKWYGFTVHDSIISSVTVGHNLKMREEGKKD